MGILNDLRDRVGYVAEGITSGAFTRNALLEREDDIMEFQRLQLLQGVDANGEDIRPYYSEDLKPSGYFWSVDSAGRYAAWKQSLSYPYEVNRNPDAPNLYINGKFHSELGVTFFPTALLVGGQTPYAKGIVAKYGYETFGLSASNWMRIFVERGAYNNIMKQIREKL